MNTPLVISQVPQPGIRLLKFRGDALTFTLILSELREGRAWIRTNIGHGDIRRKEIIREVEYGETPLGRDWFDIPMKQVDEKTFRIRLPLREVGHFEAKCFFMEDHSITPLWAEGSNCAINVEPADTCCANIIYNAFVRQFGPNKRGEAVIDDAEKRLIKSLDRRGYTIIPPSGTFRDLIKELDFIVGELGCRIIQLLPIHPTPTTYGRMGRFGSPFAALSFKVVDPALAVFDPKSTPLDQFIELVDAVHARNAKVILDIAINHTGWAARLHETHPQWLARDPEGKFEMPGAWGVRWEDLTKLDYSHKELWRFMAEVFLAWCRRGVDGFRCDAGYMIPLPAWKYMVAKTREQCPDALFFLEGLGGKVSVARNLLNDANFNWAYSELFQNYDRGQIENYLPGAVEISETDGILVHFAETHDNDRLAAKSKPYARFRTALCALCSQYGAFGFANGVEWLAAEKIDVHGSPSLNWGAGDNQVSEINRLSSLLMRHPAFFDEARLRMIQRGGGNQLVLLRHHIPSGKRLVIAANLDDRLKIRAAWNREDLGIKTENFTDLLSGNPIHVHTSGNQSSLLLEPNQICCLSPDSDDFHLLEKSTVSLMEIPARTLRQCIRAKVFDVLHFFKGEDDIGDLDPDLEAERFIRDPEAYCRSFNPKGHEPRVVRWRWPEDTNREVMVPPDHFLLVHAERPFRAGIQDRDQFLVQENSLPQSENAHFALFYPVSPPARLHSLTLRISIYDREKAEHADAPLLFLPRVTESTAVKQIYKKSEIRKESYLFLTTNGRGAMMRIPVSWGQLSSRYDALLAANLHPDHPEDRWIMFSRLRAWVVHQDFSQEISAVCLNRFMIKDDGRGVWDFHVPTGHGTYILLTLCAELLGGENRIRLTFYRHPADDRKNRLENNRKIQLVLRPDIESRNHHHTTKAYTGPEGLFPASIQTHGQGFSFAPDPKHRLSVFSSRGEYVPQPEWHYMIHRAMESERGLDPDSDLFSPGYFKVPLEGGASVDLMGQVSVSEKTMGEFPQSPLIHILEDKPTAPSVRDALRSALKHFLVKRGPLKTVIAGYPWFLDWGRDTLIVVRGLIADGMISESKAILKAFGGLERQGTLPNMLQGRDTANRDTSDAPLWFFLACRDLMEAEDNDRFLKETCEKRPVRKILLSMGNALMIGTPNGIRMDPDSGLLFSPAHFTWMDTNHPAGTPRQGYPIEIQALWFAAVKLLSRIEPKGSWHTLADKIRESISKLFFLQKEGYLSDCRHGRSETSARDAEPDDALRPNQLLAVTLGAVIDQDICQSVLSACETLLVPGAIRSLADRPLQRPLEIRHRGKPLLDPHHPYQGRYEGDEDTRRKPAYHNGTAWTWIFPSFCEAWLMVYGDAGRETAAAWLGSCVRNLETGCIGQIPEILDGNFPHRKRGCDAQAWGVSEALRVWKKFFENKRKTE